eukprot:06394_4
MSTDVDHLCKDGVERACGSRKNSARAECDPTHGTKQGGHGSHSGKPSTNSFAKSSASESRPFKHDQCPPVLGAATFPFPGAGTFTTCASTRTSWIIRPQTIGVKRVARPEKVKEAYSYSNSQILCDAALQGSSGSGGIGLCCRGSFTPYNQCSTLSTYPPSSLTLHNVPPWMLLAPPFPPCFLQNVSQRLLWASWVNTRISASLGTGWTSWSSSVLLISFLVTAPPISVHSV